MEDYNRSRGELLVELEDLRRRINEFNSSRQIPLNRSDNPSLSSKYDNKGMTDDIYYKVFLNSPDIITISTLKEGRFIEVNEGFISKIGYERYEVIGKLVADLDIWQDLMERERECWKKSRKKAR